MQFKAQFNYNHNIVSRLMMVEGARRIVDILPLPPSGILSLKQKARQKATRASVAIEGNPLDDRQVLKAVAGTDRTTTEHYQEVRNYWQALEWLENKINKNTVITEDFIKTLHSIIIIKSPGRRRKKSEYRKTECPIVDTATRAIEYAPPEPKDVPALMKDLIAWLNSQEAAKLPGPVRAALLVHRFVSIHPFEDSNGRTTRALATAELWRSGYYMQGFISVEEFYNNSRDEYYENLQMKLPVNFYDGRYNPDHTPWVNYFIFTLSEATEKIRVQAESLYANQAKLEVPWAKLSRRQQQLLVRITTRVLDTKDVQVLFTPSDIMDWFDVSKTTAHDWLKEWDSYNFVMPFKPGERIRYYTLTAEWKQLIESVTKLNKKTKI